MINDEIFSCHTNNHLKINCKNATNYYFCRALTLYNCCKQSIEEMTINCGGLAIKNVCMCVRTNKCWFELNWERAKVSNWSTLCMVCASLCLSWINQSVNFVWLDRIYRDANNYLIAVRSIRYNLSIDNIPDFACTQAAEHSGEKSQQNIWHPFSNSTIDRGRRRRQKIE